MSVPVSLPHNAEAEQEVLVGLMVGKPGSLAVIESLEMLEVDDFFEPAHGEIFEVIRQLADAGRVADSVAVANVLPARTGYIGEMVSNCSGVNVKVYAGIVKQKSLERKLIAMLEDGLSLMQTQSPHEEKIQQLGEVVKLDIAEQGDWLVDSREIAERFVEEIDVRFNSAGDIVGLSTGITLLDKKLGGLRGGQLITIGGATKMGKTALALNFTQAFLNQGKAGLFFSLEMSSEELFERRVAYEGRLDSNLLRVGLKGSKDQGDWSKLNHGVSKVKQQKLFVDETPSLHINQIKTRARIAHRKHQIDFLVVDYIGLATGDGDRADLQMGSITKGLKHLAKELDIPVIALAQLRKDSQVSRPTIQDIYGSAAIAQDSDAVLLIYRDEAHNEKSPLQGIAEINVAVQRSGKTGTVPVVANMSCYRFDNADHSVIAIYEDEMEKKKGNNQNKPARGF